MTRLSVWLDTEYAARAGTFAVAPEPQGGAGAGSLREGFADVVQVAVQSRISVATGIPLHHMEGATVLHYSPGEEITNHYDFVNPRIPHYEQELQERGQRIATFLVYLNDDYEGGETDFPQLGLRYHGGKRAGLVFSNALPDGQPDMRMVHAGLPPKNNEKWLMTQFIRNRAVLNVRSENYG